MIKTFFGALLTVSLMLGAAQAMAAGAIAVNDSDGTKASEVGYAIGTGATRDDAGANALAECKKAGNASCKVAVRYDTCGAYAGNTSSAGIGWGATEAAAKAKALDDCGGSCTIIVSDCQ